MIKEAFGIGDSIERALAVACSELGVEADQVEYEVIQAPEKKKFGFFGGADAKVRAYINITPSQRAAEYLKNVLTLMGLENIDLEVKEEDNTAEIELKGEDVGYVIGRRGETLDALQYLSGLVANHGEEDYFRVTINTGNYREKREVTLENLGRKLAYKVVKTGKNINLEPMNPYERRIIHTAVQKVNGAISFSEGEILNRHVVIAPDPKNPVKPKRNYNNKGRKNGNSNGKGSFNRNSNGGYQRTPYKQNFERKPYQNKYNKPADDEFIGSLSTFSQRSPIEKSGLPLFTKIEKKGEE